LLYVLLFEVFLHLRESKQKGLIKGWVQAGDDTVVVGTSGLTEEGQAKVWQPVKDFADRIGISFSHWKNYTESGGLVPYYSNLDFARKSA
jgi:hypothetical protein